VYTGEMQNVSTVASNRKSNFRKEFLLTSTLNLSRKTPSWLVGGSYSYEVFSWVKIYIANLITHEAHIKW
jgi:hypothetical protein